MTSKLFVSGSIMLALAALSGLMESLFYGDIGSDGVLQESLFLPLTFIFLALALILYCLSLIMQVKISVTGTQMN
ncbi:DUF3955 domain-containing protein [Psychrobacter sp. BI730]|uniref:DUF3955 domain-containing protein n=1 Tax=Psychrobacter sp. BI730 TaxID=2705463 RepID=UPI0015C94C22|nr:DUF3955 domain-containing protein [Psychrobacter sp. BI730]NYR09103.1 DUF3955 domain-containing protein [Psychrobacter sp. BI730]